MQDYVQSMMVDTDKSDYIIQILGNLDNKNQL
jgi:hypothetical protein